MLILDCFLTTAFNWTWEALGNLSTLTICTWKGKYLHLGYFRLTIIANSIDEKRERRLALSNPKSHALAITRRTILEKSLSDDFESQIAGLLSSFSSISLCTFAHRALWCAHKQCNCYKDICCIVDLVRKIEEIQKFTKNATIPRTFT